jgi:hypothetical protein
MEFELGVTLVMCAMSLLMMMMMMIWQYRGVPSYGDMCAPVGTVVVTLSTTAVGVGVVSTITGTVSAPGGGPLSYVCTVGGVEVGSGTVSTVDSGSHPVGLLGLQAGTFSFASSGITGTQVATCTVTNPFSSTGAAGSSSGTDSATLTTCGAQEYASGGTCLPCDAACDGCTDGGDSCGQCASGYASCNGVCSVDTDVDGIADDCDNCPAVANPSQVSKGDHLFHPPTCTHACKSCHGFQVQLRSYCSPCDRGWASC